MPPRRRHPGRGLPYAGVPNHDQRSAFGRGRSHEGLDALALPAAPHQSLGRCALSVTKWIICCSSRSAKACACTGPIDVLGLGRVGLEGCGGSHRGSFRQQRNLRRIFVVSRACDRQLDLRGLFHEISKKLDSRSRCSSTRAGATTNQHVKSPPREPTEEGDLRIKVHSIWR